MQFVAGARDEHLQKLIKLFHTGLPEKMAVNAVKAGFEIVAGLEMPGKKDTTAGRSVSAERFSVSDLRCVGSERP